MWQARGDRKAPKQPFLIRRRDHKAFAFAGLFERWKPPAGDVLESCTIITTTANHALAAIHPRMPVILAETDHGRWLDPATDGRPLLQPCPDDWLEALPISERINKPVNDDPSVIERPGAERGRSGPAVLRPVGPRMPVPGRQSAIDPPSSA